MSYKLLRTISNKQPLHEAESSPLKVVVLLGSLKDKIEKSNTYELCKRLETEIGDQAEFKYLHLATMEIQPGVNTKVDGKNDDFKEVHKSVSDANIVLVATPIWWGQPSSLIQRVIERFDESDKRCYEGKDAVSFGEGKILGVVVTGAEDGAQTCIARILGWGSHVGFTSPPYNSLVRLTESWGDDEWYLKHLDCYTKQMARHLTQFAGIMKDVTF